MIRLLFISLIFFPSSLILQEKDSWIIDDIRISGLQRVSAGSVFAVMPVGLGEEIDQELFKEIAHNATIIIATHDNDYLEIADKAYELNEGKLTKIK